MLCNDLIAVWSTTYSCRRSQQANVEGLINFHRLFENPPAVSTQSREAPKALELSTVALGTYERLKPLRNSMNDAVVKKSP